MPNKINITPPPNDADMLWSWLYRLAEQLNVCLNSIDEDNLSTGVREKLNRVDDVRADVAKVLESASGQVNELDKVTGAAIASVSEQLEDKITDHAERVTAYALQEIEADRTRITQLEGHDHDKVYAKLQHAHTKGDISGLYIRTGEGVFSSSIGMNRQKVQAVTFDEPFPDGVIPKVSVTITNDSTSTNWGRCFCTVPSTTVSETGFSVRFINMSAESYYITPTFTYIAIGEVE